MKNMPRKIYVWDIDMSVQTTVKDNNGEVKWVPAKSVPYFDNPIKSFFKRLGLAWDVFAGKADALYWDNK
ncbi:MAG: hypothetical protein WDA06_09890 [Phenylobacterium sp.]